MEHIDNDYLSTQVIKIPSKSKTSFSSSLRYNVIWPQIVFYLALLFQSTEHYIE